MKKIAVFDAQGPVYLMVNKEGKVIPIGNTKQLKKEVYPNFYDDFDDYFALDMEKQVLIEEDLVINKNVSVVENPGIVEFFAKLRKKGITPVIITFGTTKATKEELKQVVESYNKKNNTNLQQEEVISMKNAHSVLDLGMTKANPEDWKKIIEENYGEVEVVAVFEDTLKWLKNATKAFGCKGFLVVDEGECIIKKDYDFEYYEGNLKKMSEKFFEVI